MNGEVVLAMRGITKRFPGVVANKNVDFELRRGEVHALLGENGAGKTTLMNILYGLYTPDAGEIYVKGQKVTISSPRDAIELGIGMVHQHFMLVPTLTVVENVILGMPSSPLALDLKKARQDIRELCQKYNFQLDVDSKVQDLSVGIQQRIELIKALYRGADILIMDEPTAVLTPQEVEELFNNLRRFIQSGKSVIFISHKLWEVMRIADRVTVLRAGEVVATVNTRDTTREELAALMVGRPVMMEYAKVEGRRGRPLLTLEKVRVRGEQKASELKGVTFTVHEGEIVGLAGVDGNGQKELAEAIMGLRPVESGRVLFDGRDITNWTTKARIEAGLAHVPEDRHKEGLVLDFTVAENLVLDTYDKPPFTHRKVFYPQEVRTLAQKLVREFDIRPPDPETVVRNLSGGNQQKVVLARQINRKPRFLLAVQPTRGLDVGATEFVHQRLLEEKRRGVAILLISADLDEILLVSDRVLVIYEGQIMGEVIPGRTTYAEIGLLMGGGSRQGEECAACS
ncbi:ABC transporter ATP-binding protein [Thermanaeromonas sp. C210]|uniref:ABC transporter ATP-binding protein n=1 Tax=Thermanaeromonas sp. C210 TaxID=2731925 RepID=UPI00155CD0CF|nr:ABC transporter ATP-binding protein [Thermanaeromonas sp. C210]GFN21790.1 ABC transporter ATP-binding protein [Thermanaeromonas sp. C210]